MITVIAVLLIITLIYMIGYTNRLRRILKGADYIVGYYVLKYGEVSQADFEKFVAENKDKEFELRDR
jgi:hypothetical protein